MRLGRKKLPVEQAFSSFPHQSPQLWKDGSRPCLMRVSACGFCGAKILCTVRAPRPSEPAHRRCEALPSLYWPGGRQPSAAHLTRLPLELRETHFPAERSTPEAPARIPRADVDPRRPRDSQAPPRKGAQAPLGLSRVETSTSSLSLTRLRRRLPARALHGDALPRPLRVPA